jgi:hypothetical protein
MPYIFLLLNILLKLLAYNLGEGTAIGINK